MSALPKAKSKGSATKLFISQETKAIDRSVDNHIFNRRVGNYRINDEIDLSDRLDPSN